jgi:hypothetical protein
MQVLDQIEHALHLREQFLKGGRIAVALQPAGDKPQALVELVTLLLRLSALPSSKGRKAGRLEHTPTAPRDELRDCAAGSGPREMTRIGMDDGRGLRRRYRARGK